MCSREDFFSKYYYFVAMFADFYRYNYVTSILGDAIPTHFLRAGHTSEIVYLLLIFSALLYLSFYSLVTFHNKWRSSV